MKGNSRRWASADSDREAINVWRRKAGGNLSQRAFVVQFTEKECTNSSYPENLEGWRRLAAERSPGQPGQAGILLEGSRTFHEKDIRAIPRISSSSTIVLLSDAPLISSFPLSMIIFACFRLTTLEWRTG